MARSREELERIIDRGESVLLQDNRVITKKEDLPSAVELAGDDIVKKAHAVGDLIAARAALDAQIAAAGGPPAEEEPAAEGDKPPTAAEKRKKKAEEEAAAAANSEAPPADENATA